MQYSVFYRIQNRYKFFERFCKKYIKSKDAVVAESMKEMYEDLMEIIVKLLLDGNKEDIYILLSKKNSKVARTFFDYFTGHKTKSLRPDDLLNILDCFFEKEERMKNIASFMAEKVKPANFNITYVPFRLNEADDDMGDDDPFADTPDADDDVGGDDMGGDAGGDPFAATGDEGGEGGSSEGGDSTASSEEQSDADKYDFEGHEDDPDFADVQKNDTDDLGQPTPAGKCVYDIESILRSVNAVIQALPEEELAEIDAVKKAVNLIFNGKILKPEDVTFQNPKNAAYLLKKIGSNVNQRTKDYLMLKVKQPLIKLRDQKKEELASIKKDTTNVRDTILTMDK